MDDELNGFPAKWFVSGAIAAVISEIGSSWGTYVAHVSSTRARPGPPRRLASAGPQRGACQRSTQPTEAPSLTGLGRGSVHVLQHFTQVWSTSGTCLARASFIEKKKKKFISSSFLLSKPFPSSNFFFLAAKTAIRALRKLELSFTRISGLQHHACRCRCSLTQVRTSL